ncbi:MAG: WD40/YVTN/BNR-like repeat-containing protein, partial [Terriglobales bacterium]
MSVRRVLAVLLLFVSAAAAQVSPNLFQEMQWRMIGPFRGGRVKAVSGVPSQPNVFYFAQVNGGVWKSIDYGHRWDPIFDHEPTGSVGSIAVSVSNPDVIYVGSGEGLH